METKWFQDDCINFLFIYVKHKSAFTLWVKDSEIQIFMDVVVNSAQFLCMHEAKAAFTKIILCVFVLPGYTGPHGSARPAGVE